MNSKLKHKLLKMEEGNTTILLEFPKNPNQTRTEEIPNDKHEICSKEFIFQLTKPGTIQINQIVQEKV